jgi:hypothetical protein
VRGIGLFVYIIGKCWQLDWFVGDHILSEDFGPYGIIFMHACVVITVSMVMLLSDFGPCGIIFMSMRSFIYGLVYIYVLLYNAAVTIISKLKVII